MSCKSVRGWLAIPIALVFFWALGSWTDRAACFQPLRDALQITAVPTALLNRGSLGGMLRRLRLVRPVANDGKVYPPADCPETPLDASLFQKKRIVGKTLYRPNPDWLEELAARQDPPLPEVKPDQFRNGWPLIAINVGEEDLTGLKWGIYVHYLSHGREGERPSSLAYYVDGKRIFASQAGLRLHGGMSRFPGQTHSFRLHFREEYGATEFKRGTLFGPECEPIRRLVVHADWPPAYPFAGLLAFDMVERIGGVVPRTQPVLLVLNGQLQTNLYFLSEHVGRAAWANRVGHNDFLMYIMKADHETKSFRAFGDFHHWVLKTPEPLDLAEVEDKANLDSVSAWALAIAYGGTTDEMQGAALMDLRADKPRWSWINWDLDHSFWDVYGDQTQSKSWQKPSWEHVYKQREDPHYSLWRNGGDARSVLFTRLMNHSPVYRERFLRYAIDMLNYRITEKFLFGRIAHYERLCRSFGRTDLFFAEDYREFVRHRPALLREGMQKYFNAGAVRRVEVRAPNSASLLIDGFEETSPYEGYYFDGQTVSVEWVGAPPDGFQGWRVNGEPAAREVQFSGVVDRDMTVDSPLPEAGPPGP